MPSEDEATINIVIACDKAFVQHAVVLLKSLFANNEATRYKIFILVPDDFIHDRSFECNLGPHIECLEFLRINLADTASLRASLHVSVAAYFRLFMGQLIPANINRIIYLDSDILITGSLNELWAVDLEEYIIAAVTDPVVNSDRSVREKIRLAPNSKYFNTGVLVIDLRRWRNAKLGERALDFVLSHPELITWWDQCALNHVLDGQFKELTREWNFQTGHLQRVDRICSSDTLRQLDAAKIVHFTGPQKPWHYLNEHPKKWLYWEYLRQTEWRYYRPPDRNRESVITRNLQNKAPALLPVALTLLQAARQARKFWRTT